MPVSQRLMKDVYGIVGGAAAGLGLVADEAGIAKTSYIDAVFIKIILAPAFAGGLADTVYGSGMQPGILRAALLWRVRAEDGDAAGPKDAGDAFFLSQVEDVE